MTAQALGLDVGFDRHALPKPGHDHAGLNYGFTLISEEGNPVALARGLVAGSHLTVTLYDLTEPSGEGSAVDVDLLSLSLEIGRAREQPHDQPLALLGDPAATPPWGRYRIHPALAETGTSTVFAGSFPSWNVRRPDADSAAFPDDQRRDERVPPEATFEVLHDGYYYVTLRLEVGWTDDAGQRHSRRYGEDPEMIIDTT